MSKEPPLPSTCRHVSAAHNSLVQLKYVLFSNAHVLAMSKLFYRCMLLLLYAVVLRAAVLHAAGLNAAVLHAVMPLPNRRISCRVI